MTFSAGEWENVSAATLGSPPAGLEGYGPDPAVGDLTMVFASGPSPSRSPGTAEVEVFSEPVGATWTGLPANGTDVGAAVEVSILSVGGVLPDLVQFLSPGPPGCVEGGEARLWCTFDSSGTFPFLLGVNDSVGDSVVVTLTILVHPPPSVSAVEADPGATRGTPVEVDGSVDGGTAPFSGVWTVGNQTVGAGPSLNWSFNTTGVSNLTWTVTDAAGEVASTTIPVQVNGPLDLVPSAAHSILDQGVPEEFQVSGGGGTPPYRFQWDMGNGLESTWAEFSVPYGDPGTYLVTFEATDAAGAIEVTHLLVYVVPGVTGAASLNDSSPTAGAPITFVASASAGSGPYTYFWSFGDGGWSTSPDPSHTYVDPGAYLAGVTINDSGGGSWSDEIPVEVLTPTGPAPPNITIPGPHPTSPSKTLGTSTPPIGGYGLAAAAAVGVVIIAGWAALRRRGRPPAVRPRKGSGRRR